MHDNNRHSTTPDDEPALTTDQYLTQRSNTRPGSKQARKLQYRWRNYAEPLVAETTGVTLSKPALDESLLMLRCDAPTGYHDLRVMSSLSTEIVTIHRTPDGWLFPDPISTPRQNEVFLVDSPPTIVTDIVDTLGLNPKWRPQPDSHGVCPEGEHDFRCDQDEWMYKTYCDDCGMKKKHLSYRGHSVPVGNPVDAGESHPVMIRDDSPTDSPEIKDTRNQ